MKKRWEGEGKENREDKEEQERTEILLTVSGLHSLHTDVYVLA